MYALNNTTMFFVVSFPKLKMTALLFLTIRCVFHIRNFCGCYRVREVFMTGKASRVYTHGVTIFAGGIATGAKDAYIILQKVDLVGQLTFYYLGCTVVVGLWDVGPLFFMQRNVYTYHWAQIGIYMSTYGSSDGKSIGIYICAGRTHMGNSYICSSDLMHRCYLA